MDSVLLLDGSDPMCWHQVFSTRVCLTAETFIHTHMSLHANTHTCTHTHTNVHAHTHNSLNVCVCVCAHICMHMHIQACKQSFLTHTGDTV